MPHDPNLPRLPWHDFVADDARFEAAARTARRRVRRSAALSSAACAVVAALVVSGGATAPSVTGVAPAHGGDAGGDPQPWERPSAYSPAATASPEPSATPSPTLLPTTPPPSPQPTKSPPPRTPRPEPAPTREPEPEPTAAQPKFYDDLRHTGYALRDDAAPAECRQPHAISDADRDNRYDESDIDEKWCVRYLGPETFRRGQGGAFAIQLCRASDGEDTTLTRREYDGTAPFWHSLSIGTATEGHLGKGADPQESPISIGAGDCAEWAFTWTADATPATYTVKPWFYVWEFNYGECACPEGPPEPTFEIVVKA